MGGTSKMMHVMQFCQILAGVYDFYTIETVIGMGEISDTLAFQPSPSYFW